MLAIGSALHADDPPPRKIDFLADVYPIFQRHCLDCHGELVQEGDLRLDRSSYAEKGGHTGAPILSADVETNAILLRVTSDNPALRMPKGADPLSESDVATLRRWVEQGAPWVDPPLERKAGDVPYAFTWDSLPPWNPRDWDYRRVEEVSWYVLRFAPALLAVLCLIMACERARSIRLKHERRGTVPPRAVRALAAIPRSVSLLLLALWLLTLWPVFYQRQARFADTEIVRLREHRDQLEARLRRPDEHGEPSRPQHPPRLGGEYYRGNDERNPDLFNGGFYRTATLRTALLDEQGQPLQWEDPVGPGPLTVRIEIEQSPGTTKELFDNKVWQGTFLTRRKKDAAEHREAPIVRFEETEPGVWGAEYPVGAPGEGDLQGTIYLYHGGGSAESLEAPPHYAAGYNVKVEDGRIARDSELWLSCLYRTSNVYVTPEGKIADDEWFSFRPIPEIEGEQTTTDPKLLGIEEHRNEAPPP